eukprot:scaffold116916_cov28-Prasinocladus_malaysianus.AAC.1
MSHENVFARATYCAAQKGDSSLLYIQIWTHHCIHRHHASVIPTKNPKHLSNAISNAGTKPCDVTIPLQQQKSARSLLAAFTTAHYVAQLTTQL